MCIRDRVIPDSTYIEMTEKLQNPSEEYLSSKLESSFDKIPIFKDTYKQLTEPNLQHLKDSLKKFNQICVSEEDFSALNNKLEHPTLEYLKSKSKELNVVCVPTVHYDKITNPTLEQLSAKIKDLGNVVLSNDSFNQLQKQANEAHPDSIKNTEYNLSLIHI